MESYKENYIKGLENAFGEYAKEIIEMIRELPADVVVQTYYGEQEATIEFFYEPQEMET
jgi:radical SAM superfamily enzyme